MLNSLVWRVHRCGTHARAANTNLLNSATLTVIQQDGQIVSRVEFNHRQPKLTLRTAHKFDCCFHAKHNNDIGTLCIIMKSATFKSFYGNATKRLKLPQIRKSPNKNDLPYYIVVLIII